MQRRGALRLYRRRAPTDQRAAALRGAAAATLARRYVVHSSSTLPVPVPLPGLYAAPYRVSPHEPPLLPGVLATSIEGRACRGDSLPPSAASLPPSHQCALRAPGHDVPVASTRFFNIAGAA
jgi:hypothetical protein